MHKLKFRRIQTPKILLATSFVACNDMQRGFTLGGEGDYVLGEFLLKHWTTGCLAL